jgi:cysteine-rich repeat protein
MKRLTLSLTTLLLFGSCTLLTLGRCGDGTVDQRLKETCDDSNNKNGDGCDAECQLEELCGDGIVNNGATEQCDDGNTNDGDGCDGDCQIEAVCGNDLVEPGEECEPPNSNVCDAACQNIPPPNCGDGTLQQDEGEACDDGNIIAGDICDEECQLEDIDCAQDSLALEKAIVLAAPGETLTVSGSCTASGDVDIDGKSLTIKGAPGTLFDLVTFKLIVKGTATVIFENISFSTDNGGDMITSTFPTELAIISASLTNINAGGGARAIRCDSTLLLDRVLVQNNKGDASMELAGSCDALVANSLFVNNENKDAIRGANNADIQHSPLELSSSAR